MSDAEDLRKRRRTDQTNKPDKPELNVEWTKLQRVWIKRVQKLFEGFGPPQPSLELKRREEVMQLRRRLSDKYAELIDTWKISLRSNSEPSPSTDSPTLPREAFNRWLMERINAGGIDPLLGGQADTTLLKAATEGLEHDLCSPFLRSEGCEGVTKDVANFAEKVRSLCSWLTSEADAAAERIANSARSASQTFAKVSATLNAKRGCYVFSLDQSDSGELGGEAVVEAESESDASDANSPSFTLSPSALARLAKLMRRATRWAEKISRADVAGEAWAAKFHAFMQQDASFWDITFCLLCRYDALCGPGHKEGGGFHAAIPSVAFDTLENMDDVNDVPVRVECFASPQLCHAGKWYFCSAFSDVDIFFGSLGPFLDEEMDIGSFGGIYEVNPPFVRGVVLQLARKLLRALELAESEDRTLCIFLVLPGLASHKLISDVSEPTEKLETELDALDRLLSCRFRRALHASSRRAYTNGLAFKTERSWPHFAVPTTLALLSSQPSERRVADFERLCTSWGHSEQDITGDIIGDVKRECEEMLHHHRSTTDIATLSLDCHCMCIMYFFDS